MADNSVKAVVAFKKTLGTMIERGDVPLPSSVNPDAFRNAAIVAIQDNPRILTCRQETVYRSVRQLAAMGLVPDGREAALVPFKDKAGGLACQAIPMVYGLVKAARNSGVVRSIRAHIVYQREIDEDRFEYVVGDQERLEHRPILFGDRGDPVAVYAIAEMKDGGFIRAFMSADDVEKVRRAAASQRIKGKVSDKPIGIWRDWQDEMWKKTAIRRLCKMLPLSAEDYSRIMQDPEFDGVMKDVTPPETTEERLKRVAAAKEPQEPASDDVEVIAFDPSLVFPGDEAFTAGQKAADDGAEITDNPYSENPAYSNWHGGFLERRAQMEAE